MKLVHYSLEPIYAPLRSKSNIGVHHRKPTGFWLSDDDAEMNWKVWCQENEFALNRLIYSVEFQLVDNHNVLIIDSGEALVMFHKQYAVDDYHIDWEAVSREYQGIIITPYLYQYRLDMTINWYYTWDCASGCIWDVSAIEVAVKL